MAQNRYDRSYDNDRAPEPEKNLKTRLRYLRIRLGEQIDDLTRPFRRAAQKRRVRKEEREAYLAEQRAEKARVAEEEALTKDPVAGKDASSDFVRYGKNDFTQQNHVTGDGTSIGTAHGRRRLELTKRCWYYLLLLVVAFVFTQALHSRVSNIFFGFVVFLPLALLLYTLTAPLALQMYMASDGATVKKQEPYTYEMRILNQAPFAYPFVEAIMHLPQSNSVRCGERSVYLSMAPFGSYELRQEVRFRFRGSYEIGVECFYVYDFFRLFRVRVDINSGVTVRVLPRQLSLGGEPSSAVSDEPDLRSRPSASVDRVEVGDVRTYRPGDPLKLIHWNLTSRAEEPVVKDYHGGRTNTTYVYCDLAARFPTEPPEELIPTRRELRQAKSEERERKAAEVRCRRAEKRAERHGDPLSEDDIRYYSMTKRERTERRRERARTERRKKKLALLAELQKKDPMKAAILQDKLQNEDRLKAAKRAESSETQGVTRSEDERDRAEKAQLLADARFYEDMNEYCADGIVDLALSAAHRELRNGNEVVLIWQDGRSASGICAYAFRSAGELNTIYPLFAAAPLCAANGPLVRLSAYAGDTSGVKQIFVTAAIDRESINAFSGIPSFGGAGSGCEIVLFDPEERFLYPNQRRAYVAGCREELLASGIMLTAERTAEYREEGGEA